MKDYLIPVRNFCRHVHLSKNMLRRSSGMVSLTEKRELSAGQYQCNEKVMLIGPRHTQCRWVLRKAGRNIIYGFIALGISAVGIREILKSGTLYCIILIDGKGGKRDNCKGIFT